MQDNEIEWIIWAFLWIAVNSAVGYAIGKPKDAVADCVLASLFFGPIGWLLAFTAKGKVRTCPFCAEDIKPNALVCRHCGRDLPPVKGERR